MTHYVYQSRSIQPVVAGADVELIALELVEELRANPVLGRVSISVIAMPVNEEDGFYALDVTGTVHADQSNKFSGLTAFSSADEAFLDALENCGLERNCLRSRMDAEGFPR